MDVKKPKLVEVRPSPVAAATYVPVRPGALKLSLRDVMKKEAIKKKLEIQKQKQSLLQRQIQEQKVYFIFSFIHLSLSSPGPPFVSGKFCQIPRVQFVKFCSAKSQIPYVLRLDGVLVLTDNTSKYNKFVVTCNMKTCYIRPWMMKKMANFKNSTMSI